MTSDDDKERERPNALFTRVQRQHLKGYKGDDVNQRNTRQRMRDRLDATVFDLALALRTMERRDVELVGKSLEARQLDEAIAFLELLRRHTNDRTQTVTIKHEGRYSEEIEELHNRLERLEEGIGGLTEALNDR